MKLELGNLAFNTNKNQRYECPDWIISLLRGIESELDRVMWNINQKDYESPFENTGNEFIDLKEIFEVQAYSWNDDVVQDYNFVWRNTEIGDIKISWYKYLGRDTTINIDFVNNTEENIAHLSKLVIDLYDSSIKALRDYESKNLGKEKLPDYELAKIGNLSLDYKTFIDRKAKENEIEICMWNKDNTNRWTIASFEPQYDGNEIIGYNLVCDSSIFDDTELNINDFQKLVKIGNTKLQSGNKKKGEV